VVRSLFRFAVSGSHARIAVSILLGGAGASGFAVNQSWGAVRDDLMASASVAQGEPEIRYRLPKDGQPPAVRVAAKKWNQHAPPPLPPPPKIKPMPAPAPAPQAVPKVAPPPPLAKPTGVPSPSPQPVAKAVHGDKYKPTNSGATSHKHGKDDDGLGKSGHKHGKDDDGLGKSGHKHGKDDDGHGKTGHKHGKDDDGHGKKNHKHGKDDDDHGKKKNKQAKDDQKNTEQSSSKSADGGQGAKSGKQTVSAPPSPMPILPQPPLAPDKSAPVKEQGEPVATDAGAPQTSAAFDERMRVGGPQHDDDDPDNKRFRNLTESRSQSGRSAQGGRGGGVGRFGNVLPPEPGTYRQKELLVQRPTQAMLDELKKRGFRVGVQQRSGLVHLNLPEASDLDAWSVQRQLEDVFPQGGFGLNYVYKAYHEATDAKVIPSPVATTGRRGCSADQCYGPALIKWQPHVAECAAGTMIGVIDTGIDRQHPAFAGRNVAELTLASASASTPHRHGTGVLSLLAGSPASGTPGLIPDAEFLTVDVFFTNAQGQSETDSARLLDALAMLDKRGVQIVNMSLVGPRDDLVHAKINSMATRRGVVFVAAAGNGGPDAPAGYPAAYSDEVIAVTAVDRKGASYAHANRGDYIDVAAPGVKVWTALPDRKEGAQSGTSFAAPFVTAAIAVAYKDSPLASRTTEGGRLLDPKGIMLTRLFAETRNSDLAKRDPIYGLGVLRAPSRCGGESGPWLSVVKPTPAPDLVPAAGVQAPMPVVEAGGGWGPTVQRASLPVEGTR